MAIVPYRKTMTGPERKAFKRAFYSPHPLDPMKDAIWQVIRRVAMEEAVMICIEQELLMAPEFATDQPLSSFAERSGAHRCGEAIAKAALERGVRPWEGEDDDDDDDDIDDAWGPQ